jgi:hypothetical protein
MEDILKVKPTSSRSRHMDEDDVLAMIEDCENSESELTEWEADFIESISDQIGRGLSITAKQVDKLDSIWQRVTREG